MSLRPIYVMDELREVNAALLDLLPELSPEEWRRPTVHPDRDVKDLVAHLLDGSLRRLAMQRDAFFGEPFTAGSYEDLVAFIQRLNRRWMDAARRLSPRILIELVGKADAELVELLASLPPDAPAAFGVAWAGEDDSAHWFDVAREYTEKWHHQAQIRDAVGRIDLRSRRHMHPVISTFVRGMPHAYRSVAAPEGTAVQLSVTGDAGGVFCLSRQDGAWDIAAKVKSDPDVEIVIPDDDAWRLWTKSLRGDDRRSRIAIHGDADLAAPLLAMTCIMA